MAHLGGFGAETAVTAEVVEPFTASNWQAPRRLRALLPRSFRTKFMLVVGFAVLFTLTVSVFIALWTIDRLARDASREVEQGLTNANQEYLSNYIETTALRTEAILDGVFSQVTALAGSMQTLLDHPETKAAIGRAVADDPYFGNQLDFDSAGDWAQNKPGAASVLSVGVVS